MREPFNVEEETQELTTVVLTQRTNLKVKELCVLLRALAYEKGPGAKLPSTRTLCELLSTTPSTLNDAIKELEAQNIIYSKQRSGLFVSPKLYRRYICTLFYADLFPALRGASPFWGIFWALFAREMQLRTSTRNEYYSFHFVLDRSVDTLDLPEEVVRMIEAGKVHGVLAAGMHSLTFDWLTAHQLPSVTFAGLGTCMVTIDGAEQTRLAVSQLAAEGCRTIGLWRPHVIPVNPETDSYFLSFLTTLAACNKEYFPELVQIGGSPSSDRREPDYQEQGYQLAYAIFGNPTMPKPDGIFIIDDLMTSGVLRALSELDIRVGVDVKLVSHANAGSPTLFREPTHFSLVEVNPADIVQTMFSLLDSLLAGQIPDERVVGVIPRLLTAR